MKVTKNRLMRLSESFISQRVIKDSSIVCAYMTGSMLQEDPFFAETTDVDIVLIHDRRMQTEREIISISPEVTFDFQHISKDIFDHPRRLRADPWLGSFLCFDPVVLYGKGHWFEFMQASVESSFFMPEVVIQRAHLFSTEARRLWLDLRNNPQIPESHYIEKYLNILSNGANAISCLSSVPLSSRRLMIDFAQRCEVIGNNKLPGELFGLILGENDPSSYCDYYLDIWSYYYDYFANSELVKYVPEYRSDRKDYYAKPIAHFWKKHLPTSLWILLNSFCSLIKIMELDENEYFHSLCSILEISPEFYQKRVNETDAYLDMIEDCLDSWGADHGLDDTIEILI